jgi:hypothetical protein
MFTVLGIPPTAERVKKPAANNCVETDRSLYPLHRVEMELLYVMSIQICGSS